MLFQQIFPWLQDFLRSPSLASVQVQKSPDRGATGAHPGSVGSAELSRKLVSATPKNSMITALRIGYRCWKPKTGSEHENLIN